MVEIQGPLGTGETGSTPEASRSSSFASFAGPQMLAPVYQLYFNKILKNKNKKAGAVGPCTVSWPISCIAPFDFSKPLESGEDSSHCPDEETEAQIVSGREPACPSFHWTS